jgi:hypothetical protein
MKPLNAVFCRTVSGDTCVDWIGAGARNLLRRLCVSRRLNWTSSVDAANAADLIVAAGGVEWRGSQFRSLLDVRNALKPAWLFIGVDHFAADLRLTVAETDLLKRALVITRSAFAHNLLAAADINSVVLPCPSLFVCEWESPPRNLGCVAVFADCGCRSNEASMGVSGIHDCVSRLKNHYGVRILCRGAREYLAVLNRWAKYVLYCPSASDCVEAMSRCDITVASCTHTAFVAHSLLKPAILLDVSATPPSAADQYPHLISSTPSALLRDLKQIDIDMLPRALLNWKRAVEARYLATVSAWSRDYGLDLV